MICRGPKTGMTVHLLTDAGRGQKRHGHLAVIDLFGDGATSVDQGHRHRIADGVVGPGPDGHTHERQTLVREEEDAA